MVTELEESRGVLLLRVRIPWLTVVGPENVFAAERMSVPPPLLVRPPFEITPEIAASGLRVVSNTVIARVTPPRLTAPEKVI